MKPIYKSLLLAAMTLQVSVSLQAQVNDGTATSQIDVPAEVLDSLRVELVAPNVSGARDLIKSRECTISDNTLSIDLQTGEWLKGGVYRLQVSATFGTQTLVIYALDVTVPRYDVLASEPQEYEDTVTVVSTYGDGTGTPFDPSTIQAEIDALELSVAGKADGSVYGVDEQGDPAVRDVAAIRGSSLQFKTGAAVKFEITQDGNLVLYNNGEPVTLTPAKLAELIA